MSTAHTTWPGELSAFPHDPGLDWMYAGLTKRELLAAMAMQGMNAAPWAENYNFHKIAAMAVNQADALLTELAKEPRT